MGYRHPYAARTWSLRDWEGYLSGLAALGYDMVMIWPLLDSMPPVPTPSDRAFLHTIARAIDLAHDRFGMRVAITVCPNTIGNEAAAAHTYRRRPYFTTERQVNPGDPAAVAAFLEGRRRQLAPLARADALAIIDSDPGGYIGSTNDEFVSLMQGQAEVFRGLHPGGELIYWMFIGWENYNRFWAAAQRWQPGDPAPRIECRSEVFIETLRLIDARVLEPWSLFACLPEHVAAVESLGLGDKAMAFPYGLVEGEPTFPLTELDGARLARGLSSPLARACRRGAMANAQTPCLQLPHIALFAHLARGGCLETMHLAGFADRLLPGQGERVAQGWQAIAREDADAQRSMAQTLRLAAGRLAAGRPTAEQPYSGLVFSDPERFLNDLAMNLLVRATLAGFNTAVQTDQGTRSALRGVLRCLRPYQRRLGFVDAYGGTLEERLNGPLARLGDERINRVLEGFRDWRNPAVRNGILPRLLDALEDYCRV